MAVGWYVVIGGVLSHEKCLLICILSFQNGVFSYHYLWLHWLIATVLDPKRSSVLVLFECCFYKEIISLTSSLLILSAWPTNTSYLVWEKIALLTLSLVEIRLFLCCMIAKKTQNNCIFLVSIFARQYPIIFRRNVQIILSNFAIKLKNWHSFCRTYVVLYKLWLWSNQ